MTQDLYRRASLGVVSAIEATEPDVSGTALSDNYDGITDQ
jgi:hypothetical protein